MIPAQFDYSAPESVADAVSLLHGRPGARILAGGQDLLTAMKLRHVAPSVLVDLRKIDGLRGVQPLDGGLRIGAMVTCTELFASAAIQSSYHVLAEAADSDRRCAGAQRLHHRRQPGRRRSGFGSGGGRVGAGRDLAGDRSGGQPVGHGRSILPRRVHNRPGERRDHHCGESAGGARGQRQRL